MRLRLKPHGRNARLKPPVTLQGVVFAMALQGQAFLSWPFPVRMTPLD